MAQYENLKAAVADVIKQNGVGYITGDRLQTQLFGIINNVGKYATFAGVVQPNGSPVAHDGPTFYLTGKPGTYANFGGVKTNGISVISNQSGAWVATRILDLSEYLKISAAGSLLKGSEIVFPRTTIDKIFDSETGEKLPTTLLLMDAVDRGFILNARIVLDGSWDFGTNAKGYIFMMQYIAIDGNPEVDVRKSNGGVPTPAKRFYDEDKLFIGTSYTEEARFLRLGTVVNSGVTIKEEDAYGVRFTVNGIIYTIKETGALEISSRLDSLGLKVAEDKIISDNRISDIESALPKHTNILTPRINTNIDADGNLEPSPHNRISIENYMPITGTPSLSVTYLGDSKGSFLRYYDSDKVFTGLTYSEGSVFARFGILFGEPIPNEAILKDIRVLFNEVEYVLSTTVFKEIATLDDLVVFEDRVDEVEQRMQNVEDSLPMKENILPALINKNDRGGRFETLNGRIAIDHFFEITSNVSVSASHNGDSKTVLKRHYDADKNYISPDYSSDAVFARYVIRFSEPDEIENESILEDLIFTFGGVEYSFGDKFEAIASKKDISKLATKEELANIKPPVSYAEHFMQIFPKYTVIGDSLTAGFTSIDGLLVGSSTARPTKNNWPGYLEKRTGQTFLNLAIGSSHTHHWRYTDGPSPSNMATITEADVPTDCYMIALGVNDLGGVSLGSSSDIAIDKEDNGDTYYGNYDWVVRKLHEYNPNAHILLLNMPDEGVSVPRTNFNNAIAHIAGLYDKVHLINMHDAYPTEFRTGFMADNKTNGHWNPMAYNFLASLIQKEVTNYIYDNFMLFRTVPYFK